MTLTGRERVLVAGVSPTGGLAATQESATTQDIANLAGAGEAPLTAVAVTSNATGGLGSLPANRYLLRLLARETAGHSVVVTLGTTSGGSDVAPSDSLTLTVPASGTLTVDLSGFLKNWFSATAAQALFLASASWGGASVNAQLDYEVGP